jgi:hypothetical protein
MRITVTPPEGEWNSGDPTPATGVGAAPKQPNLNPITDELTVIRFTTGERMSGAAVGWPVGSTVRAGRL